MAERIVIASLDIDVNSLVKSTADLKSEMDRLKQAQKDLIASGQGASEQFVQNASDLRALSTAYNQNIRTLSTNTQALADQEVQIQLVNLALETEAQTIQQAREQIALLTRVRNQTNTSTEEGRAQIERLNIAIDQNNEYVRANVSAMEQQRMNVGNYTNSIRDALSNLNPLNGGISGFISRSQEAGGTGNLFRNSLSEMATGFAGLTKASLTFIATPIGAVLAVLVGAFALIKNALDRSSDATAKLSKITGAFSGVLNFLLKALQPVGEFLIDGIVAGFELAVKSIEIGLKAVSGALKFLGLDKASQGLDNLKNGFEKSAQAGINLAKAEKELEDAQRKARLTQLEFQKDAEKFRQIRDDETKSTKDRIFANEQLGKVLKDQLKAELDIANTALKVANLRIQSEGKTKATLDAQYQALTEIADIQERITGQESEQLVNRVSLQKEANDKAREFAEQQKAREQKAIENQIKNKQDEINLFIAQQGIRAKTLEEQLKIEEEVNKKKLALNQLEYDKGKKSKLAYETEKLNITNQFAQKQQEIFVQNIDRELKLELAKIPEIIKNGKIQNDLILENEKNRIAEIEKLELASQKAKLENGAISETEYQDAITLIQNEAQLKRDEAEALRLQTKAEADALNLENKRAIEDQLFKDDLAIQLERLEEQRLLEVAQAEKLGADLFLINEKYANKKTEIEKKNAEIRKQAQLQELTNNLSFYANVGNALQTLFGKNKALASATAFINGALGVTEILKTPSVLPEPLASIDRGVRIATVVGTTTKAISDINSKGFSEGGYTGNGGKLEPAGIVHKGEVVFSQADVRMLGGASVVNSMRPTAGYSNGGIVAKNTSGKIETNLIEILRNLPTPIVTVEDINTTANRVNVIESNARF